MSLSKSVAEYIFFFICVVIPRYPYCGRSIGRLNITVMQLHASFTVYLNITKMAAYSCLSYLLNELDKYFLCAFTIGQGWKKYFTFWDHQVILTIFCK